MTEMSDISDRVPSRDRKVFLSLGYKEQQLPKANTPHEQESLKRTIAATDNQSGALVYELYGLTDEEIEIVEGDTKWTPFCRTIPSNMMPRVRTIELVEWMLDTSAGSEQALPKQLHKARTRAAALDGKVPDAAVAMPGMRDRVVVELTMESRRRFA